MIAEHAITLQCPDCASEVRTIELAPHVYTVAMFHDDTCPWINQQEQT